MTLGCSRYIEAQGAGSDVGLQETTGPTWAADSQSVLDESMSYSLSLPPPPLHGVEDLRGPSVGLQKQEAIRHRSGDEHLHVGPPLD